MSRCRISMRREWSGPWTWVFTFGIVCVFVAITGQAIKAAGVEVDGLKDGWARVVLAVFGTLLSLAAASQRSNPSAMTGRQPSERRNTSEQDRIRVLQQLLGLHGTDIDGLWGLKTRNRCLQQQVGSPLHARERLRKNLAGNQNRELVRWVQDQLNRKYDAGIAVDGVPGRATHLAIVRMLGETDGVVGPRGYRTLVLE